MYCHIYLNDNIHIQTAVQLTSAILLIYSLPCWKLGVLQINFCLRLGPIDHPNLRIVDIQSHIGEGGGVAGGSTDLNFYFYRIESR